MGHFSSRVFLVALFFKFTTVSAQSVKLDFDQWIEKQANDSFRHINKNISVPDAKMKGFIVASPERNSPNYYYHWVRDAALVMDAIFRSQNEATVRSYFNDYVNIVLHHQSESTKIADQGEVKFEPNGTAFVGGWCRPQNDGPALRAMVLTKYANLLLASTNINDRSFVNNNLYRQEIPANTAIKRDLEYVAHHWQDIDCDLWEEVHGHHFYTRMAQRTALTKGAQLADRMGDHGAAQFYRNVANEINNALVYHWDQSDGYIRSTIDWDWDSESRKPSSLDSSTVLAVNHSWIIGQNFGYEDERIFRTINKLLEGFHNSYEINWNNTNPQIGTAIGRYTEDIYYGGNPWFLLTSAFAEFYYKLGSYYKTQSSIKLNASNKRFFLQALNINAGAGAEVSIQSPLGQYIVNKLGDEGDKFLRRVQVHGTAEGRLDEQFSRYNGFMTGAPHLTWSYAAFMTAAKARKDFFQNR